MLSPPRVVVAIQCNGTPVAASDDSRELDFFGRRRGPAATSYRDAKGGQVRGLQKSGPGDGDSYPRCGGAAGGGFWLAGDETARSGFVVAKGANGGRIGKELAGFTAKYQTPTPRTFRALVRCCVLGPIASSIASGSTMWVPNDGWWRWKSDG